MAAEPSRVAVLPAGAPRAGVVQEGLQALRARWWVVLLAVALAMAASAVATARQPRLYRASTSLVVAPASAIDAPGDILRTLETLERRSVIATFARIPGSPQSRAAVAARMGLGDLNGWRIEGSVLPNTNIIRIDAEGPDAARAADVANLSAEATRREARALYRIFSMRTLAQAVPPTRAAQPDLRRNLLLAAAVGLLLGVLGAFGLERRHLQPPRA